MDLQPLAQIPLIWRPSMAAPAQAVGNPRQAVGFHSHGLSPIIWFKMGQNISALLSLFVSLPLCVINVPSVIWLTLYKLFALLAGLGAIQHIFSPPVRLGLGLNQAEWSRCVAKLNSLWRHHQTAAVEAPTGTGKEQVLLSQLAT